MLLCYTYAAVSLKLTLCVLQCTCTVACTLKVGVHVLACKLLWLILCVVCKHYSLLTLCKFVLAKPIVLVILVLTGSCIRFDWFYVYAL